MSALFGDGKPVLSAIIISRDDERSIASTVASVVGQEADEPIEVIVVTSGTDRTAAIVRETFPSVRLVVLDRPALPGRARNAGVAVARGEFVSFPGSHVTLPPGSLDARIKAHRKGFAMVSGTILNGTPTPAGWASYFMDHSDALPGRPSGQLSGPPPRCSYQRDALLMAGPFPEDMRAGEDTVVNQKLWKMGMTAYRDREVSICHISRCRTPSLLIRHHFVRGRAWGRILAEQGKGFDAIAGYVTARMRRTTANVQAWGGELASEYRRVMPLVRIGITSAWLGVVFELAVRRFAPRRARPVP